MRIWGLGFRDYLGGGGGRPPLGRETNPHVAHRLLCRSVFSFIITGFISGGLISPAITLITFLADNISDRGSYSPFRPKAPLGPLGFNSPTIAQRHALP